MTSALAALTLALCQPGAPLSGIAVDGYPGSIAVWIADGTIVRVSSPVAVTEAYRWDGPPLALAAIRPGDRVRVDVEGDYLSAYYAGTAVRVVVGPPAGPLDGPDAGFVVAQESWVAGQDAETRALVRNLASRSWAVRERATRGLMEVGRAGGEGRLRAAGALAWGLEQRAVAGDAEARGRVMGLRRALWIEMEVGR